MPTQQEYEEYERIVLRILEEQVRRDCPDAEITIAHNQKRRGRSGHEHQIDVLAELNIGGFKIVVLAECKRYRSRVTTEEVLELVGRIEDLKAHKGLIVTTVGFQPGAHRIAQDKGIGLVLVGTNEVPSWQVVLPALIPAAALGAYELLRPRPAQAEAHQPITIRRSDQILKSAGTPLRKPLPTTSQPLAQPVAPPRHPPSPSRPLIEKLVLTEIVTPETTKLAKAARSASQHDKIRLVPQVLAAVFGSVCPWAGGPYIYNALSSKPLTLVEASDLLEELLGTPAMRNDVRSLLLSAQGLHCGGRLANGMPFAIEFSQAATDMAMKDGVLPQLYRLHIAFWLALYANPSVIGKELVGLSWWYPWFPLYGSRLGRYLLDPDWPYAFVASPGLAEGIVHLYSYRSLGLVHVAGQSTVMLDEIAKELLYGFRKEHYQQMSPALQEGCGLLVNNLRAASAHHGRADALAHLGSIMDNAPWLKAHLKPYVRFVI